MRFRVPFLQKNQRIYLDHAAASPVRAEVLAAMLPYFSEAYGNPGAIHQEGAHAKQAVEDARLLVARTLRVRARDITFTGSGTEANNLAILGYIESRVAHGAAYADLEIISTPIEHPSVLRTLQALAQKGVTVHLAPVNAEGRLIYAEFTKLLSPKTALVTIAYVNSEIGVIQDIKRISRAVTRANKESGSEACVHVDASQAPLWLPCQLDSLGAMLMTLDAGKCGGPKGVGILVHRHDIALVPVIYGGDQESGLRSGTENVPLIVGCAVALRIAQDGWKERSERVSALRDALFSALASALEMCVINGSREHRVANNVNISLPGVDSEYAVIVLDQNGIAASTQSACSGRAGGASPVIDAISHDEARASSTIRFTLGERTKTRDLTRAVSILKDHVRSMQHLSGVSSR